MLQVWILSNTFDSGKRSLSSSLIKCLTLLFSLSLSYTPVCLCSSTAMGRSLCILVLSEENLFWQEVVFRDSACWTEHHLQPEEIFKEAAGRWSDYPHYLNISCSLMPHALQHVTTCVILVSHPALVWRTCMSVKIFLIANIWRPSWGRQSSS